MILGEYVVTDVLGPLNEVEKKNAPPRLYLGGDRRILSRGARVAVVGSRKASARARGEARKLSGALASRGVVVVSGLAEGIDTAAHEAAIASGGRTVAVLGTPLSDVYPPANRALQDLIMREHLAVSQFRPGSPIQPQNFPMRNRTMALVADATVVVEAGEKSGTIHLGWEALRLGKPLFFADSLLAKKLAWLEKMLGYGAQSLGLDELELLVDCLPMRDGADASELSL